mmetsp:Transcript_19271/g.60584  ORF Transcript_19271/g.60584 Transcript_19271/m.60584 type:complete len:198 (+) Transcript_19271:56-649(+)
MARPRAWTALLLARLVHGSIWLRRDRLDCAEGLGNFPLEGMNPVKGGDYTLENCKTICDETALCEAIMVPQSDRIGPCRLFRRVRLSECRRSKSHEVWERLSGQRKPPEGTWTSFGNGTACRAGEKDKTEDGEGSVLVYGAPNLDDCKGLCGTSDKCYGVEYEESVFRCEVWTRPIGYVAQVPLYECLAYRPEDFWA